MTSIDDLPKKRKPRRWPRAVGTTLFLLLLLAILWHGWLFLATIGLQTDMASCLEVDARPARIISNPGAAASTVDAIVTVNGIRCWSPVFSSGNPVLRTHRLHRVQVAYERECIPTPTGAIRERTAVERYAEKIFAALNTPPLALGIYGDEPGCPEELLVPGFTAADAPTG